jgi:hypothetical protein
MTVARLAEQLDSDSPPEALPGVVPDTPPAETELAELRATVAALTARLAEFEAPQERWLPLKSAAYDCAMVGETLRAWCEAGLVEARREGKRWYVNVTSVKARQRRLGQRK